MTQNGATLRVYFKQEHARVYIQLLPKVIFVTFFNDETNCFPRINNSPTKRAI